MISFVAVSDVQQKWFSSKILLYISARGHCRASAGADDTLDLMSLSPAKSLAAWPHELEIDLPGRCGLEGSNGARSNRTMAAPPHPPVPALALIRQGFLAANPGMSCLSVWLLAASTRIILLHMRCSGARPAPAALVPVSSSLPPALLAPL